MKWPPFRRVADPPPSYVTTWRFRRRTVDFLGKQWAEQNARLDAMRLAAADKIDLTGRVIRLVWTVIERAPTPPFATQTAADPADVLELTVILERAQ